MTSEFPRPASPSPDDSITAAAQLRLILEAPSIIIFSLDRDSRYTSFNGNHAREMKRIWGAEIERGMDMLAMISSPEDRARAAANFDRALAGEEFTLVEEYGDDALSRCYYENRYCPTKEKDGTVVGVTVFVTKVTEQRRETEERLRTQSNLQRAAKVESLEVLAGGIAHDFNNLLGAILGFAEIARDKLPEDSEAAEPLDLMQESAERAAGLTHQLLTFAGRGQTVIELCDLTGIVASMEALLRAAVSKKAELLFEATGFRKRLKADPAQIQQVVMNLALNASQALGEGRGTIRISTGTFVADEAFVESQPPIYRVQAGSFCTLEVRDDGVGIQEEHRARILEPFYTTRPSGRGLGLAAVQGIVRALGGFLEIESQVGQGTSVRVGFPCAAPADSSILHPASPEARTAGVRGALPARAREGLRILASDDEQSVRELLHRTLASRGFRIELVENGAEALRVFLGAPDAYDLLLLDLTTPRTSGLEALREIRRMRPRQPVLLMSGYCAEDVLSNLEDDPCTAFLHKPFRIAALVEEIQRTVGLDRLPTQ